MTERTEREQGDAQERAGSGGAVPGSTPTFADREKAREAGLASGAVRREKARQRAAKLEKAARSSREVIADVLTEEHLALEELVRSLIKQGAGGDLRAAQTLVRYLDQAYGRPTETVPDSMGQLDGLPQLSREERARLIAELRERVGSPPG
jgi:hypothetical protein